MKTERKIKQRAMDETLEDSFPASDPPSWSMPSPEKELHLLKKETKARPDNVEQKPFSKDDFLSASD